MKRNFARLSARVTPPAPAALVVLGMPPMPRSPAPCAMIRARSRRGGASGLSFGARLASAPARGHGQHTRVPLLASLVSPVGSKGTTLGRKGALLGFKIPHLGFSFSHGTSLDVTSFNLVGNRDVRLGG